MIAIVFNALTWPSGYFIWRDITDAGRRTPLDFLRESPGSIVLLLLWLLFPISSVVFAFRAVRGLVGMMRYGRASLVLDGVPVPIGGQLRGVIRARGLAPGGTEDVVLGLECRSTEQRRQMDEHTVSTSADLMVERVVPGREIGTAAGAAMIPVDLPMPPSGRASGERVELGGGDSATFSWWLVARAEPRGWSAAFEVPVLRTAATPAPGDPRQRLADLPLPEMIRAGEELKREERQARGPAPRPPSSRIAVRPADADGVAIEYPPQTGWARIVAMLWVYTLPLYTVPLILFRRSEIGAALGWLAFALVVNGGIGWMWLHGWPLRLVIGPQWITLFYSRSRKRMPTSEAGEVSAKDRVAIGRKGQTNVFKYWFFVSPRLSSSAEARWLGAEIERAIERYR